MSCSFSDPSVPALTVGRWNLFSKKTCAEKLKTPLRRLSIAVWSRAIAVAAEVEIAASL